MLWVRCVFGNVLLDILGLSCLGLHTKIVSIFSPNLFYFLNESKTNVFQFEIVLTWTCVPHYEVEDRLGISVLVRVVVRKERDYVGKIPKWRTPPQFGKPLLSKKSWVYFSFQNLRNIFGLHQKITILNKLNRHQGVGLGQTPPSLGIFSNIMPFFSDCVPQHQR